MNIRNKIGSKIEQERKSQGLTQIELAQKSGVAERTVRNIELGNFDAKIDTVEKIANALNYELDIVKK